jgi:hypothetical protein
MMAHMSDACCYRGASRFRGGFPYISHCGITDEDMDRCGSVKAAILDHYRVPGTSADAAKAYNIDRVAHDLLRWPPVVERLRELRALANSTTPTIH